MLSGDQDVEMNGRSLKGSTGYGQVKQELAEIVIGYFRPYREIRKRT